MKIIAATAGMSAGTGDECLAIKHANASPPPKEAVSLNGGECHSYNELLGIVSGTLGSLKLITFIGYLYGIFSFFTFLFMAHLLLRREIVEPTKKIKEPN
ncbi:MAG: hypothetical protein Q8J78_12970 [Moraxellaceae bacterium]|nr:hypothetical protein [Moraxellaceae bacterium]